MSRLDRFVAAVNAASKAGEDQEEVEAAERLTEQPEAAEADPEAPTKAVRGDVADLFRAHFPSVTKTLDILEV